MANLPLDLGDLTGDSPDRPNSQPTPDTPELQQVAGLAKAWDDAQALKKRAEAAVEQARATIREIEEQAMPTAMEAAGLRSFVTKSGRSITVEDVVRGNIPAISTIEKTKGPERQVLENRRMQAYAIIGEKWPGLIKTEVSVALGKGETELAAQVVKLLREQFDVTAEVAETIHPQTLNSHFKELLAEGKIGEVPPEPFSLYIGPIAKIK